MGWKAARNPGIALALCALAACGDDGPTPPPVPEVGRVELSPDTVRLLPGQSQQLMVSLFGPTGTAVSNVPATWTVADAAIARVGTSGVVEAVAPGLTTVTVTAGGKQAQALVGVGLTGTYALRLADGLPVPRVLDRLPNCPPSPGPEPGPNPREYRVRSGVIRFTPGSGEQVEAELSVLESCPYSTSEYYNGIARSEYDVDQGMVKWRAGATGQGRLPSFGDARIKGDSLIVSWKPDLGDSIRFHFVRQ